MPIILNTSSLSTFHRTRSLDILSRLFHGQQLLAPEAVANEFKEKFTLPEFIQEMTLNQRQKRTTESLIGLALGEREAIVLANDTGGLLIIDDRQARKKANEIGVKTTGCLNIVKSAFIDCHILKDERDRIVREGSQVSYWPSEIVEEVMRSEKPKESSL